MTKEEILQKEFASETYVNLTVYEQRKILNAMEEYAQYKINEAIKILSELCRLKNIKDKTGKTLEYKQLQPQIWETVKKFLNNQ